MDPTSRKFKPFAYIILGIGILVTILIVLISLAKSDRPEDPTRPSEPVSSSKDSGQAE